MLQNYKNLAEKLSDIDEILTSKSTQMVFSVVKFLSKSDNFLAKFLNYLKGPPHDFFQNSEIEFLQDVKVLAQYNLRGASKLGLGQLLGQLCQMFSRAIFQVNFS